MTELKKWNQLAGAGQHGSELWEEPYPAGFGADSFKWGDEDEFRDWFTQQGIWVSPKADPRPQQQPGGGGDGGGTVILLLALAAFLYLSQN